MDSILQSVKKKIGLDGEYEVFDDDIVDHINMAFSVLHQLGVGPSDCFTISGGEDEWTDFIGEGMELSMVKSYIYAKVRMIFDPPTNSILKDALEKTIAELEFRLSIHDSF